MNYVVSQKTSFLPDFSKLSRDMQKRVTDAIEELYDYPDKPRGNTIKKLKKHDKLWRYRIGDYRLVYGVFPERKVVQLLGIGHRKEIYKRFRYHPDEPEFADYSNVLEQTLNPDEPTPPEWIKYLQPEQEEDTSSTLTYRLTPKRLNQWGVPPEHHHHFLQCETENELLDCGAPMPYIMSVIEHLEEPSFDRIAQEPNLVLQDPKDLTRYAKGDLLGFLLLLDTDQERFVDWALKGPTLVKGGPGSGKSTVALYRAQALVEHAKKNGKPTPSVLFTTYTNALINASEQLLDRLLDLSELDVEISTLDRIAMRIVRDQDGHPDMAHRGDLDDALISAKAHFAPEGENQLERLMLTNAIENIRSDYLIEELEWVIEGRDLKSLDEYLEIDRSGRGYAFNPSMRKAVWNIYEHVCRYLEAKEKITWGQLRSRALHLVQSGRWKKRWDYVIIDEAQDLTPTALALCVELAQDPAGIFLTADASQSLYNRGFAWKDVHDSLNVVGRTRILRRNYRTTRQIVEAAVSLIEDTRAGDEEVLAQEYVHVGPKPVLYFAENESDQIRWIAEQIRHSAQALKLPTSSAAILTPTNWQAEQIAKALTNIGLISKHVRGRDLELKTTYIKAMTIHAAKGLEFPIVVIPGFEAGTIPRPLEDERASDREKHLDEQRRITFVAMTRAMRRLFVVCRKGKESPFLEDFDLKQWNIQ